MCTDGYYHDNFINFTVLIQFGDIFNDYFLKVKPELEVKRSNFKTNVSYWDLFEVIETNGISIFKF